ncbi:reverse transcriptase [Vairimorpha necatrix]|uniref:Reverse transcriptase n=1 Tax=Vairimorpha necatrix TaxID=6039 RepID=A0AAX4JFM2_9MICR
MSYDYIEFEIKVPGLKAAPIKRIKKIQKIRRINIKDWIEDFNGISKSLNLTTEEQKIIKNFTEIAKYLKAKISGKMNSAEFIHNLKYVRQIQYENILEFYETIKTNLDQYANIEDLEKEEFNRRLREIFFDSLALNTATKLKDLKIYDVEEAMEYLIDLEEDLKKRLTTIQCSKINKQTKRTLQKTAIHEEKQEVERKKLWCFYCLSTTHSFAKCWFKDKNKKKNNDQTAKQNKERNYLIKEDPVTDLELLIEGRVNEIKTKMAIDTGSSRNYISKELANKAYLEIREDRPLTVTVANYQKIKIDRTTEILVKFNNNEGVLK